MFLVMPRALTKETKKHLSFTKVPSDYSVMSAFFWWELLRGQNPTRHKFPFPYLLFIITFPTDYKINADQFWRFFIQCFFFLGKKTQQRLVYVMFWGVLNITFKYLLMINMIVSSIGDVQLGHAPTPVSILSRRRLMLIEARSAQWEISRINGATFVPVLRPYILQRYISLISKA